MNPLISVIVPVYNTRELLEKCVYSIANQTYRNLEILLVDDGSTDGSGALCDTLAGVDDRIIALHKENGGSSSARNLGISTARGEYFGFIDSDDYIEPDMYELMVQELSENENRIIQISRDEINEDGSRRPDVCTPPTEVLHQGTREFFRTLLMHEGDCSFCTKLVPAFLFADKRFPEGELNEDFKLLISMLPQIQELVILPRQGYHVFYRVGSNTRKKDPNDFSRVFMDIVRNADYAEQVAKEYFPGLETEALRFGCYQRLDYLLHIPVARMTGADPFYKEVVRWVRAHRKDCRSNPYLTEKQKKYLLLLGTAPKAVRSIHKLTMKIRHVG